MRSAAALAALALAVPGVLAVPGAPAADVHVTTSISPRPARFGDVVHATLTVRSSAAVTVQQGFAPFQVVAESTTRNGDVRTWHFDLQCLEARCVPGPGARSVAPAPARVQAGSAVIVARFPAVRIEPRVTEAQVAHPARSFLHPTTPPAPSFRFDPGSVQNVLLALAAGLVLAALALVLPLVRRRSAPVPAAATDSLERALALVQAARSRSPADRRRALGLLARVLRRNGAAATGQAAADLAWSEPEPDPARMTHLVERVEGAP
jgi:hypothetical protein